MELRFLFLLLCVHRNGVSTFTVILTKSPDKAVFGTNQFQLTCTYTVGASELANSFGWQRKRASEQTYTNIATFFPPYSIFNGSIIDSALNSRVSLTEPTTGNTNSVLTFSEIQCNDEAEYRCEATYTIASGSLTAGDSESVQVSNKPTLTSISLDVTEYVRGQSVTLTCSGEGNPTPSTQWVLSNGTVVQSSQLYLMDLSLTADHNYTCQLQNNYGGINYTDSQSVVLTVVETTTSTMTIQATTIQPTTTTTAESNTKKQKETCMECPLTVTAIVSTLCGIVVGVLSVLGTIYIKVRYTGGKTESNVVPNSQEPPSMTDIAMTVHTNVTPDGTQGRMDEACYQDLKRDRAASASEYQTLHITGRKTESNVIPNSQEPPSVTDIAMTVYTNVAPDGTHGQMDEGCYQDLKQDRAASVLEYQTLNLTDTASR